MNLIKERDKILVSIFYPLAIITSLIAVPILLLVLLFAPRRSKLIKININKLEKY